MENLNIKTRYSLSKRVLFGGGLILVAVILCVLYITLEFKFLAGAIPLLIMGILILTPVMSTYSTQIKAGKGFLEIKWPDRMTINVLEAEIDRITLTTNYIFIFRKARKPVKLVLLDKEQKREVFKFFNEYAAVKSITLINQDEEKG